MRALFDVNVLIALHDSAHAFHHKAHDWWARNATHGWSSCPLTENGMVRIMSNPNYSRTRKFTPHELIEALRAFVERTNHEFWTGEMTLRDPLRFNASLIHSSQKLAGTYLLALAVHHLGCLVTFDRGITISPVIGAEPRHLRVL